MNIKSLVVSFIFALFSSVTFAGANHDHDHGHDHGHGHSHEPVTQQQAEANASRVVATLIKRGVIDKSWDGTAVKKAEQKEFGGRQEWVVSYHNESISDAEKRTLYIFLTLTGDYIAANYSGK